MEIVQTKICSVKSKVNNSVIIKKLRIQFCFKLINKTQVQSVQLEKTLDFNLRINLLVQNFIASCQDFLAGNNVKKLISLYILVSNIV